MRDPHSRMCFKSYPRGSPFLGVKNESENCVRFNGRKLLLKCQQFNISVVLHGMLNAVCVFQNPCMSTGMISVCFIINANETNDGGCAGIEPVTRRLSQTYRHASRRNILRPINRLKTFHLKSFIFTPHFTCPMHVYVWYYMNSN